jgi:hypothetical protein
VFKIVVISFVNHGRKKQQGRQADRLIGKSGTAELEKKSIRHANLSFEDSQLKLKISVNT